MSNTNKRWTDEDEYHFWADRDLAQDYQDYLDIFGIAEEDNDEDNYGWEPLGDDNEPW